MHFTECLSGLAGWSLSWVILRLEDIKPPHKTSTDKWFKAIRRNGEHLIPQNHSWHDQVNTDFFFLNEQFSALSHAFSFYSHCVLQLSLQTRYCWHMVKCGIKKLSDCSCSKQKKHDWLKFSYPPLKGGFLVQQCTAVNTVCNFLKLSKQQCLQLIFKEQGSPPTRLRISQ